MPLPQARKASPLLGMGLGGMRRDVARLQRA